MTNDMLDHSRRKFFHFGAAALFASATPTHAMAQSVSNKLKIGVIGSGHIGGTIAWIDSQAADFINAAPNACLEARARRPSRARQRPVWQTVVCIDLASIVMFKAA